MKMKLKDRRFETNKEIQKELQAALQARRRNETSALQRRGTTLRVTQSWGLNFTFYGFYLGPETFWLPFVVQIFTKLILRNLWKKHRTISDHSLDSLMFSLFLHAKWNSPLVFIVAYQCESNFFLNTLVYTLFGEWNMVLFIHILKKFFSFFWMIEHHELSAFGERHLLLSSYKLAMELVDRI